MFSRWRRTAWIHCPSRHQSHQAVSTCVVNLYLASEPLPGALVTQRDPYRGNIALHHGANFSSCPFAQNLYTIDILAYSPYISHPCNSSLLPGQSVQLCLVLVARQFLLRTRTYILYWCSTGFLCHEFPYRKIPPRLSAFILKRPHFNRSYDSFSRIVSCRLNKAIQSSKSPTSAPEISPRFQSCFYEIDLLRASQTLKWHHGSPPPLQNQLASIAAPNVKAESQPVYWFLAHCMQPAIPVDTVTPPVTNTTILPAVQYPHLHGLSLSILLLEKCTIIDPHYPCGLWDRNYEQPAISTVRLHYRVPRSVGHISTTVYRISKLLSILPVVKSQLQIWFNH